MDAFLSATGGVFLSEMGDKTQLLALFLAAYFAQKNAIILGIFCATFLNHAVSAFLGVWVADYLSAQIITWFVGISFILVGLWLLIPDKDDSNANSIWLKHGAFTATLVLYFLAEMGDKTQIATVLLAVKYQNLFWVITGSVVGLMLANLPIVYLGERMMQYIPAKIVRVLACGLFCLLGMFTLISEYIAN